MAVDAHLYSRAVKHHRRRLHNIYNIESLLTIIASHNKHMGLAGWLVGWLLSLIGDHTKNKSQADTTKKSQNRCCTTAMLKATTKKKHAGCEIGEANNQRYGETHSHTRIFYTQHTCTRTHVQKITQSWGRSFFFTYIFCFIFMLKCLFARWRIGGMDKRSPNKLRTTLNCTK